ncbi:hypothetical protein [Desulfovibrio sp.]|uniref:hypothetical protein n=1 Tax=Desulfovibrio sp. TaxID=885 RepID=UPI0025C51957|nr:hypothetical protein [Desulfovibrio sp.]
MKRNALHAEKALVAAPGEKEGRTALPVLPSSERRAAKAKSLAPPHMRTGFMSVFTFEKGENARRQHSAARPEAGGKIAFSRATTGRMV